jgi:hypothetical protein
MEGKTGIKKTRGKNKGEEKGGREENREITVERGRRNKKAKPMQRG